MPVTRRSFLTGTGRAPSAGVLIAARGLEAFLAQEQPRRARDLVPAGVDEIRLSSNENPLGPGRWVLDAVAGKFSEAGRYPFNSTPTDATLAAALAASHKVKPENIVLGGGSQEILKIAVRAFTSPRRGLVTAAPTFENCTNMAKRLSHPVVEVPVDSAFRLDVQPMIAGARDAGLVFFNNPNNPTSTVHSGKTVTDMVERIRKASPDTIILIDEAYHEYVTDPSYATAIPLALATPNVVVTRTFSKAFGMAGLRVGYGIGRAETMKRLAAFRMPYNVNVFGVAAAMAALPDARHVEEERARNTEVRTFTEKALKEMGCAFAVSQTNFLFVDVRRPAKEFREACAKAGVVVGRDFPPFEKTHVRISIGTMDEMRKAVDVFRSVLRTTTSTSASAKGEE